ncbi:unnamed protein product, partial [Rotaria sp. Silwood2]
MSSSLTTPSTLELLSNEFFDYIETHREKIPLLIIVYILTIIWIIYLILYHSRIQGIILSYILRRFYFKDATQMKFDSFSISFISGSIMFRNLHYTTGNYFVCVRDGCLTFRYWSRINKKSVIRLRIKLNHVDILFCTPIRSNTISETNNLNDDLHKGLIHGNSTKTDDTQSVNTVKGNEEGFLVQSLRSLFPAIEIKIQHGRISIRHNTLPYSLSMRFSTMTSIFTSESPSKYAPQIDLMTLIYSLTYRNLRIQLYRNESYQGEQNDILPPIPPSKKADVNMFQIFECSEGELEYEQDVPGKMIEQLENGESIPGVHWEIRIKCNKETKIAYGPWADRQRELLWQYFLPTIYEESLITSEPSIGQTRIFKSVHFKLLLNCPTTLDLYFMNKMKLQQLHIECPLKGSHINAVLPFSTNPDGFDTFLSMNILQPIIRTNLSFSPLAQAENILINVHIHYPRLWNSLQNWLIDITAKKPKVYFVFEHKNFFQGLINDWSSSLPPDIYSFTPFIYDITVRGDQVEILIPCNQGNWIDCSNGGDQESEENNYVSLCAKSLLLTYPLVFSEFCPKNTATDLTIETKDILARLVIPRSNRMYYIIEGLDMHKRFYTPEGVKSQLSLSDAFDKRDDCFECGEASHLKILIQILLHSSPPIDTNRTDLLYVQHVRSMGNRQTFHPNKLDYDIFNIEIDIGPVNLLLHGLFLKNLWWVKENLFGWDQMYHDINEPELIREKQIIVSDDPLVNMIDENHQFDPRYFRPLMVNLRVALHNITAHLIHHSDNEPCPIGFCERLCVEMTTNLDETKVQVLILPVNVYVEDTIIRNKSDQHLSTGSLQLSGLIIRGHAMLSHEGLPPERETLEYAWQMEILLGKISARVTTIQVEKLLAFLKNFYLQMIQDEYTLIRSPVMDKTKWIEKLKYEALRFSLDSVDLSIIEVAPVRLCMCNMHTSLCNESLTLKVGTINIRQLLRLYPGSWIEAGSIHIPELRMNAKFDCHPPTQINIIEQIEFLRRHDQQTQRLHFLYNAKSQQSTSTTLKRPSNFGLQTNINLPSCACLGGSSNYYTLVSGEQFFKSSFRLSEQTSFGRSLFRPDLHVIHSHPIFQHKYDWNTYKNSSASNEQLNNEENFYPFDFCLQQSQFNQQELHNSNSNHLDSNIPTDLYSCVRSSSLSQTKHKSSNQKKFHKRSSSSIPSCYNGTDDSSSSATASDAYLTPTEHVSLNNSRQKSLDNTNDILESLTVNDIQHQFSLNTTSIPAQFHLLTKSSDEEETVSIKSSDSSSTDSLAPFEEILRRQQSEKLIPKISESSSVEYKSIPPPSLPSPSWINLSSQMKMPIPKSTLLCTTYIRYLSHYRSSTWSNISSFPPLIQQDQINHHPLLDFNCVSQGFSCSFLSEPVSTIQSRQQYSTYNRSRSTATPTMPSLNSSSIIATEKEMCLRFSGALNILLTPLMLECITTYIETWKTYELHPMSVLDGLHVQAQTTSNFQSTSIDLSSTKISLQLPKINICLLQAGLAEDHVQLTELQTPVDIVTMSLFALSCKQIRMETILSKRDQSTAGIFKIESITGQFRRFENNFSLIENVNIHAIQSQRCRLQFHVSNDTQTHLPIGKNRKNAGFVMNEFGLQRLCFKLINNAAKQQQERTHSIPIVAQINEIQTSKPSTKQKSKRKHSSEPVPPSSSTTVPTVTVSPTPTSLSSSVFDGSIDHVWISFPEPPRHTHSTSNLLKRSHTSSTTTTQEIPMQKRNLSSYTRYDWNFLSTLSPTVLGWFCVIDRVKKPCNYFIKNREKRLDAILAYFLIEKIQVSTITHSKLYMLFTPKTKYLLSHPVCQLVTEFRKHFNRDTQVNINLQSNTIPEIEILKRGIRESCRAWAQTFKLQAQTDIRMSRIPTSSPFSSILSANNNDQEQMTDARQTSTMVSHFQHIRGHEFSVGQPSVKSRQHQSGINNTTTSNSTVRKRTAVHKTRSSPSNKDTIIEMNKMSSSIPERRRASSYLGDALRRLEPTANVNNTAGYRRLSIGGNEFDFERNTNNIRSSNRTHGDSFNGITYYTDASSVEELFKILLEYAGVELSVTSSIEPLFEKLGQTVLASAQIKQFDVKILPNELINDPQLIILNPSAELSILGITNLNVHSVCKQSLEYNELHSANVQAGIRVQHVKQEFNLSLLRLVYQFYTVVGNAFEYISMDEIGKTDTNIVQQQNDSLINPSRRTTINDIDNFAQRSFHLNTLHINNNDLISSERECWKKLRELVAIYQTSTDIKQLPIIFKQHRSLSELSNDDSLEESKTASFQLVQKNNDVTNETLLLSAFGWLIIDEIYYAASLGSLKVDGCIGKVQGSISLSQRLRALQANTNNHNSKKYDGSLIVQLGSTSLSLKETLSTSSDTLLNNSTSCLNETASNTSSSTREISVLDIIVGKSRALTSLQTRSMNLRLSGVTNIGTIAMDVPLRPQEVHDLVNRAGRLITSYVQEFLPDDTPESSTIIPKTNDELEQINTKINDTVQVINLPTTSEQILEKNRLHVHRKQKLSSHLPADVLQTQTSISSVSKKPIFEVHIIAHCQGMTFSTTLLSTLKAQYKIGIVEGVANLGTTTSRFTAIVHEHALHFLNNNNTNSLHQLPTVSSDNHVRIDFPQIRCYGNYIIEQEQNNKSKGHLNIRTKIDLLKLTITSDFLAQLVFVSKVIIHEINEILAKVSGVDQFQFRPTESKPKDNNLTISDNNNNNNDNDFNYDDDEQEKISTTLIIYK